MTPLQVVDIEDENGNKKKISLESGNEVQWVEEENYKFRLRDFRQRILEHFKSNPESIVPQYAYNHIIQVLGFDLDS